MHKRVRNERGEMDGWDVAGAAFWIVVVAVVIFGIYKWFAHENHVADLNDARYARTHDKHVYAVTGTLLAPPNSLVRQTKSAHGELNGGMVGGIGGVSGQYDGAQVKGKNFVRLSVTDATPSLEEAQPGHDVLLKTVDTKTIALAKGDNVTFVCTRQYERVGAGHVWELDGCRIKDFQAGPR
jgi:hypothetical protein